MDFDRNYAMLIGGETAGPPAYFAPITILRNPPD